MVIFFIDLITFLPFLLGDNESILFLTFNVCNMFNDLVLLYFFPFFSLFRFLRESIPFGPDLSFPFLASFAFLTIDASFPYFANNLIAFLTLFFSLMVFLVIFFITLIYGVLGDFGAFVVLLFGLAFWAFLFES